MDTTNKMYCFLFLIFFSCSDQQSEPVVIEPSISENTTLLFFKKENKVEIWSNGNAKRLLHSFQPKTKGYFNALGHFSVSEAPKNQTVISYVAQYKVTDFIIFPDDPRPSEAFVACFACPHHIAETYATLELLLKSYPSQK